MTQRRPRCRAIPFADAVAHMRAERGHHFDPGLLDPFLSSPDELHAIRAAHPDPAPVL